MGKDTETVEVLKKYFCINSCSVKGRDKLIENFSDSTPHSTIAEIEAFYLLHKKFGLDVVEYEPKLGNGKKPDFLIKFNGNNVAFEVKDKSGELVRTERTRTINARLDRLEKDMPGYMLDASEFPPLSSRDFDNNIESLLTQIEKSVRDQIGVLQRNGILEKQDRSHSSVSIPITINAGEALVLIRKGTREKPRTTVLFTPDEEGDIECWLFGKNGDAKIPMVTEAEKKGADYLVCQVPEWRDIDETFADWIKPIFSDIQFVGGNPNLAESSDNRLGEKLSGVILFPEGGIINRDEYLVVKNKNVTPKIDTGWFRKKISSK